MTTVIRAGLLFDGTGRDPIRDGAVVISQGRISWAGPFDACWVPGGAEVIVRPDETLMPGMVNSHSHVSIVPALGDQMGQMREHPLRQAFRAVANMRKELLSGVTTLRVMGEENLLDIEMGRAVSLDLIPGPRLIPSGVMLTSSNGHGRAVTVTDGPDEVRRRVRQNLAAGARWIKLFVTGGVSSKETVLDRASYSKEEILMACEEAHRAGVSVAAHAHGGIGVKLCLECGVDSLEHAAFVTPEDVEQAKRRGTWLVGTFSILFHPEGVEKVDASLPEIGEKIRRAREAVAETWSMVVKSGAKYALGTDSMHGMMWYEAERLVELGASNLEALMAVTSKGAACCGVADCVGTLEPGKLADVITVRGNPLEDISALSRVGLIVKGGRRYDGLSAM